MAVDFDIEVDDDVDVVTVTVIVRFFPIHHNFSLYEENLLYYTKHRYNVNGFVEELPQLPENRYGHSCAAIPSIGVRLIFFQSYQLLNPVQEYIVAGGRTGSDTDSVLSLLPGASSWTTLASLPRTVYEGQASLVGGNMRVAGGDVRDQVRINNLPGRC